MTDINHLTAAIRASREGRARIWQIVVHTQGAWHRYRRSCVYDTPEIRLAFRNDVVFGLRRFADEYEALLCGLVPALGETDPARADPARLVPPGLRHTLGRYLAARRRRPEEFYDDELRVLAVGLWGLWDKLEDGLREAEAAALDLTRTSVP